MIKWSPGQTVLGILTADVEMLQTESKKVGPNKTITRARKAQSIADQAIARAINQTRGSYGA